MTIMIAQTKIHMHTSVTEIITNSCEHCCYTGYAIYLIVLIKTNDIDFILKADYQPYSRFCSMQNQRPWSLYTLSKYDAP